MKQRSLRILSLTQTALLLALCLGFQLLKSVSIYITGPLVNAVLIIASVSVGWQSGLAIALLSPIAAWLIGATPIVNALPVMLPVIAAGNTIIAVFAFLFRKSFPFGLLPGALCKAGFLWGAVCGLILPAFGQKLPEKLIAAAKVTFSLTQLINAILGSLLAWLMLRIMKKRFRLPNNG